jgi:hypothetical protein
MQAYKPDRRSASVEHKPPFAMKNRADVLATDKSIEFIFKEEPIVPEFDGFEARRIGKFFDAEFAALIEFVIRGQARSPPTNPADGESYSSHSHGRAALAFFS